MINLSEGEDHAACEIRPSKAASFLCFDLTARCAAKRAISWESCEIGWESGPFVPENGQTYRERSVMAVPRKLTQAIKSPRPFVILAGGDSTETAYAPRVMLGASQLPPSRTSPPSVVRITPFVLLIRKGRRIAPDTHTTALAPPIAAGPDFCKCGLDRPLSCPTDTFASGSRLLGVDNANPME